MTDETPSLAERIQDAIQAHLDSNGGGFPTEFLLTTNYIDSDGESSYYLTAADNQTVSTSLGLLRWGTLAIESEARRHFDEDAEW